MTAGPRTDRLAGTYAAGVVRLRWLVLAIWVGAAAAGWLLLPGLHAGSGDLGGLLPTGSTPVRAERQSATEFDFPLVSRTMVVQRDPAGLAPAVQARAVAAAVALDAATLADPAHLPIDRPAGALPVSNAGEVFPSSSESGTTLVTALYFAPSVGFDQRERLAQAYAQDLGGDVVGVAGTVPARVAQGRLLQGRLLTLELATLALVVVVVGAVFRSVVAPLLGLVTALLAYLVTTRVLGTLAPRAHLFVPQQLEPLLVALVLGVVTDYTVFYVSGLQQRLAAGSPPRGAVREAVVENTPVVLMAGLTVTAGTAALLVAPLPLFRAFGPGLALTVVSGLVVAVTLVPAALAVLGTRVFWPSSPPSGTRSTRHGPGDPRLRTGLVRTMLRRPVAAVLLLACLAGLAVAAVPLRGLRLQESVTSSLPATSPVARAAAAAGAGFAPGIWAPTVLVVSQQGVTGQRDALARLQGELARQPGVAGVVGPADLGVPVPAGALLARDGDAARFLVVLDSDPLGARALATLDRLGTGMPRLLAAAGLPGAGSGLTGDSAIAADLSSRTTSNLLRILAVAFGVELLLLAAYLRAVLAPLLLMLVNALTVSAALGLTSWLFQGRLGVEGVAFYVPFSTAVLLVALGADYNVFGVGRIWAQARGEPLREALLTAVPRTTRAVNTAGITLAGSFGLVALIPLDPFRQIAFTMAVGLLLDTLVVRALVVPALFALLGSHLAWPGRLRR